MTRTASWQHVLTGALRRSTVFLILAALAFFFSRQSEQFWQKGNLTNIAEQNASVIVMAVGMTLTMLLGGIDLSVGSVAALSGAISAGLIVQENQSIGLGIVSGLGVGFGLGIANGMLVVYGRLPPFVATLAMLGVARGLTLVYTEGKPIPVVGDKYEGFTFWGRGDIGPIPAPVVVWIVVVVLAWLLLSRTRFGLHIYAIGGGEETSRLAGVLVNRVKILTYGLSGLLAGLGGLMLAARLWSAQPRAAEGFELQAIAAAVLGGVSLFGGVGGVIGAVAGALLVGMLGNGMNLLDIPSYPQQVIQGGVLVLAVTIDMYIKRLERR